MYELGFRRVVLELVARIVSSGVEKSSRATRV